MLRAHGLARQVVAAAAAALEGPAHADLAFGVCTLLYLLFEDGARPNLDLVAEPVVHLLVHALALGHSAALSLDPRVQLPKAAPTVAATAAAGPSLEDRLQPHFADGAVRGPWGTAAGPAANEEDDEDEAEDEAEDEVEDALSPAMMHPLMRTCESAV